MKKQIIIVGIIIVIVLLIIGFIYLITPNVLPGETSIKDINEHSNKYMNQTVTIRGSCITFRSIGLWIVDSAGNSIVAVQSNNIVKPTQLIADTQYKFTGIVRYGTLPMPYSVGEQLYLEVTKIEKPMI